MGTTKAVFDEAGALQLVLSMLFPILVALFTKISTHPGVRAIALLGISVLSSVVKSAYDAAENHTAWQWQTVVYGAIFAFVVGVATHFGLWSPTGASTAAKKTLIKDAVDVTPIKVVDHPIEGATAPLPKVDLRTQEEQYQADLYSQRAAPLVDLLPAPTGPPVSILPPTTTHTKGIGSLIPNSPLAGIPEVAPASKDEPTPLGDAVAAEVKPPTKRAYVRKTTPAPVKKALPVAKKVAAKKTAPRKAAPVKRSR